MMEEASHLLFSRRTEKKKRKNLASTCGEVLEGPHRPDTVQLK